MTTALLVFLFLGVAGHLALSTSRDMRLRVAHFTKLTVVRDDNPKMFWIITGARFAVAATIVVFSLVVIVRAAIGVEVP